MNGPKQVSVPWWKQALGYAIFLLGVLCIAPFGWTLWRALWALSTSYAGGNLYETALRAAIAIAFGGVVLCVLLLLYRFRNEDTSPSLQSGLAVIAIGALLAALDLFAARPQSPPATNCASASSKHCPGHCACDGD